MSMNLFDMSAIPAFAIATRLRLLGFLEAELLERRRVFGALGGVQDFDADNAAFLVVVHDDATGDLFAVFDRPIGQVEIDRVCRMIHSHPHGFPFSVMAGLVPAIHALLPGCAQTKTWMPGSSPGMTTQCREPCPGFRFTQSGLRPQARRMGGAKRNPSWSGEAE